MSIEVQLDSTQDFQEQKQKFLDEQIQIIDTNMESWFNDIVIPEAKRMAKAMILPEKFIEAIEFVKTGEASGRVVNNFGSKDVPLAVWFNYGTKRNYLIEPKVKNPRNTVRAERDKDIVGDQGQVQHPTWLHWIDEFGRDQFRLSVIHPGFPKTLAMEFGVAEGIKRLKSQLPKLLEGANE